jgi:hypothetical protein
VPRPSPYAKKNGTTVWRVRFRDSYGKQTCETFFDQDVAKEFCGLLGVLNPEESLKYLFRRAEQEAPPAPALDEWAAHYLKHLTGITDGTRLGYERLYGRTWQPLGLATIRLGGREYPLVSERACKTCSSPHRDIIERDSVSGRNWATIIRSSPDDAGLSERNLSDHWRNGHLPVEAVAVSELAERQAEQRGAVVKEAAKKIVDYLDFAQTVVGRVNERVATGDIEPSVADALRAADLLARYQPETTTTNEADYLTAFMAYHETAAEIMTAEQFQDFGRRLEANQVLRELSRRYEESAAQHEQC